MCAQLYFPPCVLCRGHTASHQYKPWGRKEMTMQWMITNRRDCRLPLSEGFYTSLQCWIAHIITTCRGSLLLVVIQQQALVRGTITELQDVSSMKVVVSRGGIRRKRGREAQWPQLRRKPPSARQPVCSALGNGSPVQWQVLWCPCVQAISNH